MISVDSEVGESPIVFFSDFDYGVSKLVSEDDGTIRSGGCDHSGECGCG